MAKVYHVKFESDEVKSGDELAIAALPGIGSLAGVIGAQVSRSFGEGPAVVVVDTTDAFDEKLLPEGATLISSDKPADAEEQAGDDTSGKSTRRSSKAAEQSGADATA